LWHAYFLAYVSIILSVIASVKAVCHLHHHMIVWLIGCGSIAEFVGGCWAFPPFFAW
jgi:hypothetical protein